MFYSEPFSTNVMCVWETYWKKQMIVPHTFEPWIQEFRVTSCIFVCWTSFLRHTSAQPVVRTIALAEVSHMVGIMCLKDDLMGKWIRPKNVNLEPINLSILKLNVMHFWKITDDYVKFVQIFFGKIYPILTVNTKFWNKNKTNSL